MNVDRRSRRNWLRTACRHCLGWGGLAMALPAAAQAPELVPQRPLALPAQRFQRPAIDTDEGGLWAMMDREEARLRRSAFLVRDAALQRYLEAVLCRLAGDHCRDLRVYLMRSALFNATMAPNGMLELWSGLLLRMDNEAQLAAVLAHELGHYFERHSIEQLRDTKNRAAFAQFMGLFGMVGTLGQLGSMASSYAFPREQEQQADRFSIYLMQRAGYDAREAARVWGNLQDELKVSGKEDGLISPLLATHPSAATRRDALLAQAGGQGGRTGAAELREAIAGHRMRWLQDEVRRGQFEESLALFDRKLQGEPDDGEVLFARAEVYRQRAGEGDAQRALADLARAIATPQPPAEAFRALGLTHRRGQRPVEAAQALERYLALAPEAPDAPLMKAYLQELRP